MPKKSPVPLRVFFKKNGLVRPFFARHFLNRDLSLKKRFSLLHAFPCFSHSLRDALPKNQKDRFDQCTINAAVDFGKFSKIIIISTPSTLYIAELLSVQLTELGISSEVQQDLDFDLCNPEHLYIVFSMFVFNNLPPASQRIAFQVEQREQDHYFTLPYLASLNESLAVIDYSSQNIEFLRNLNPPWLARGESLIRRIFFYPISPVKRPLCPVKRDGIIFYGALTPYRRRVLAELGRVHDVRVLTDVFGSDLHEELSKAKVVLNIHRSQSALLETTRISESLSFGAQVVSETVVNEGEFPELEAMVKFAPAGDIDALSLAITEALNSPDSDVVRVQGDALYQNSLAHLEAILSDLGIPYNKPLP